MRAFGFHPATELEEALALKAEYGARGHFIAGGTDLLVGLRAQSPSLPPVEVIDITRIGKLDGISLVNSAGSKRADSVRLGPLVTHAQIAASSNLQKWAMLLAEASAEIGSPQIRNRATIGGNIANGASCADTVPPLIALGAELTLRSVRGARRVLLEEVTTAPYETILAPDEMITEIDFPPIPGRSGSAFVKLGRRNALSISRMSIAVVVVQGDQKTIKDLRIAAGSVVPTVRRFRSVESVLRGESATIDRITAAGEALAAEMVRISGRRWSTPYKEPVVAALLRRALERAIARAQA